MEKEGHSPEQIHNPEPGLAPGVMHSGVRAAALEVFALPGAASWWGEGAYRAWGHIAQLGPHLWDRVVHALCRG